MIICPVAGCPLGTSGNNFEKNGPIMLRQQVDAPRPFCNAHKTYEQRQHAYQFKAQLHRIPTGIKDAIGCLNFCKPPHFLASSGK